MSKLSDLKRKVRLAEAEKDASEESYLRYCTARRRLLLAQSRRWGRQRRKKMRVIGGE